MSERLPALEGRIRVASVPEGHVYVRHLSRPSSRGGEPVVRLRDPRPNGAPSTSQRWWPPVMLDPDWVRAHGEDFDVFHLHFGFDAQSPAEIGALLGTLRAQRKPLVYTVHDLRNPHQPDRKAHDAVLDVLIPAADHLVTLTPGSAAEIARRWNRPATVVPHPHVVGVADLDGVRPERETFTVGVHAKSLRPNMELLPVVRVVADTVAGLDAVLRVDIHCEVRQSGSYAYAPAVMAELEALRDRGLVDLRVHDYFDDRQLYDYLRSLDVSVLPYAFGTHSGWLEACYDLGTAVIAPDCGFYAQQRPCLSYGHSQEKGLDEASLRTAVLDAYRQRPRWQAAAADRLTERGRVAAVHERIYTDLLQ
ncbi:glycosyltransferase [Streptacidiphilus sp. PB12-B1b]|nr:glycosyltransferase [Streptacidiphilus sp. PB12-B1b]